MSRRSNDQLVPRNGVTAISGLLARISGCQSQKELSLDDQLDHGKEEVEALIGDFPVEYRTLATKGKGERLDRPELAEVERWIRSRELDLLVMEDVGRLVRGAEAVRLWGIAVDHGVRCIAPNDCLDTADDSWEEDLLSACRDHVGHNAHTSKRLKKKLMNRFIKHGGSTSLPIAGYKVPGDAKTFDDWEKIDTATKTILSGLDLLKKTLNCSAVADYFNSERFPTGPYCKADDWSGAAVRRFYKNRLLSGHPGRGFRVSIKHHQSGRRVSVKNTKSAPNYLDYPHLAHVDDAKLFEVNRLLTQRNANRGRKTVKGIDPFFQKPKKRTRFPGQHACCWYCGHQCVWGGNGMTNNLMCSNSRNWHCWHSIGFNGSLATERILKAITSEMYKLDAFDDQFASLVRDAHKNRSCGSVDRWQSLRQAEQKLSKQKQNLMAAILEHGPRPMFDSQLNEFDTMENELRQERRYLDSLHGHELVLPSSVNELRGLLEKELEGQTVDSYELSPLLQQLVPRFHVYAVRLCDGGHLLPRARIELNLGAHIDDLDFVPELRETLTKVVTLDLFELPPQRERIRIEVVQLLGKGLNQREIAKQLTDESPKQPTVQRAIALENKMQELGLDSPYVFVSDPPDDYPKLRRHNNPKYHFESLPDYERPSR